MHTCLTAKNTANFTRQNKCYTQPLALVIITTTLKDDPLDNLPAKKIQNIPKCEGKAWQNPQCNEDKL